MGALYVFNPTESPLLLTINGEQVGSLRACSAASGYKPFGTWLTITKRDEEPGTPHLGKNTLGVLFENPRASSLFSFSLSSEYFSLEEDAIAFVLRDWLILTTQAGLQLRPNPLPVPASPFHPTD